MALDVPSLWQGILSGKSGIHPLTVIDASNHKVRFGGDVPGFDPGPTCEAKDAKRLDRFTQFAMWAAYYAVADCGIDFSKEDSYRCGAILGSGIGGLNEIEEQMFRLFSKGPDRVSPFTIPKMMLNAAGGNLAIQYGLRGPNFAVATACASSNNAMGDALKAIQYGEADVMLTGGTEAAITAMGVAGFSNMRRRKPVVPSMPTETDSSSAKAAVSWSSKNSNMPKLAEHASTAKSSGTEVPATQGTSPRRTNKVAGPLGP
jgi:3-oxoacyl-[acyl-carrier-protein] synthase II